VLGQRIERTGTVASARYVQIAPARLSASTPRESTIQPCGYETIVRYSVFPTAAGLLVALFTEWGDTDYGRRARYAGIGFVIGFSLGVYEATQNGCIARSPPASDSASSRRMVTPPRPVRGRDTARIASTVE